eukprot:15062701-Heterocapsa_arctica.AAC.1
MDTEVQSSRRALKRAAAATVTDTTVQRAATQVPDEPPTDSRHLFCWYAALATGCSRGDECSFAHRPMGTLTVSAYVAK